METYLVLKYIHIISAMLLFGTGLGTAFYMWRTYKEKDVRVMASVCRNVVLADWLFTAPAVLIQLVTGIWMWLLMGMGTMPSWIWLSLILYIVVGLCWLPVVWIQIQLARMSRRAAESEAGLSAEYHRYMRVWFILGWPAFISVLVILYLMVLKPV